MQDETVQELITIPYDEGQDLVFGILRGEYGTWKKNLTRKDYYEGTYHQHDKLKALERFYKRAGDVYLPHVLKRF